MRTLRAFALALLLSLPIALALLPPAAAAPIATYTIGFDLAADGSALEQIIAVFAQPLPAAQRFTLSVADVRTVSVHVDGRPVAVNTTKTADGVQLSFLAPAGAQHITAEFRTNSVIFAGTETLQFFTNLQPPTAVGNLTVTAALPAGYVLARRQISPAGAIGSDGNRIIIRWSFTNPAGPIPLSFQYRRQEPDDSGLIAALVVAAAVVAALAWFLARRRMERSFLFTFLEDERNVLLAVRAARVTYQNKIERQFGFSRAKMTRIVQKLERRGLVEKQKAGRTNRLVWRGPAFPTVSFRSIRSIRGRNRQ